MGSCQSRLHRHKAGGGQEQAVGRAVIRKTAHRFPSGLSRWEQQLTATRASPPPLPLSTGFSPVGAATGSYTLRCAQCQPFAWGKAPSGVRGSGARWVAVSRGSTGTRPAEAQHCAANARNTLLSLSTGLIPEQQLVASQKTNALWLFLVSNFHLPFSILHFPFPQALRTKN